MSLVSLTDVEFTYGGHNLPTLKIPSFKIEKGEKVFLYGPSGSGKTTLLEMIAGVIVPQKGSVSLLGQDIGTLTSAGRDAFRASHMGYVFQSFNLIPYLSVQENIELPLYLSPLRKRRLEKSSAEAEVKHLTRELGIERLLERKVTELSIGQQQRVAVARALLGSPELILADEPTSALDYDHREKFIQLLFKICNEKNTTVLFVSHDRSLEKLFSRSVSLPEINQVSP